MSRKRIWCVGERHPTGPDKIYHVSPNFETQKEAAQEKERLEKLPEKAGYRLFVRRAPEEEPARKRRRRTQRRSDRKY